jgi:hypothetical protein
MKCDENIVIDGVKYSRRPVKTRIIKQGDDFIEIINTFASDFLLPGDLITICESPLAITQGRAIHEKDIKVGFLANILWRFVSKVPYGIGLRSPTSMQCAIDECGSLRIVIAAIFGGFSRVALRRKGDFYRIAGMQAALIDAAYTTTVDGYQASVIKGPLDPQGAARSISHATGYGIAIMDINDIGGSWCIGHSETVDKKLIENIMRDNPQGQGDELTPICIVRRV